MTRYLSLAEYFWIAGQATGVDAATLARASRVELAESALHAPQAEIGGHEFYPDPVDKAAVLVCRLARNHPLPDGNKRAAWVAMRMFIALNGGRWTLDPADIDEAEATMLGVAAGEIDQATMTAWLRQRVRFD